MFKLSNYHSKYCNLNIIVHLSTIDWYGHSSITLFFNGCQFNCQYCYNEACIYDKKYINLNSIKLEILKAKPFISSVVFLGGEPLNQISSIIELSRFSKKNNLLVGIHTNGYEVNGIKRLIKYNLIDKYFIDIKAPFNPVEYSNVIFMNNKSNLNSKKVVLNIQKSIKLVDRSLSQLELKTTIFPTVSGTKNQISNISKWIKKNIRNNYKTSYVLQKGLTVSALNKKLRSLHSCYLEDIKK